jgi:hypothetical protein
MTAPLDLSRIAFDRDYATQNGFILMVQIPRRSAPGKRIGGVAEQHVWAIVAPLDTSMGGNHSRALRILCPDSGTLSIQHIRRSLIAPRWPARHQQVPA